MGRKFKNIQFQVFHHSCMALGPVGKDKYGYVIWLFECFHNGPGCKGEFEARPGVVRRGETLSCGCSRRKDITGKIYHDSAGNSTCQALWYLDNNNGPANWLFRCLFNGPGCEYTFPAYAFNVESGEIYSCGCYQRLKVSEANTKHGMTSTPEYQTWYAIHERCYNPNNPGYQRYGGRGIKVCWRWHRSNPDGFKNFLADMGPRPDGYSIERYNNNGDYSPDNCGWEPPKIQAWNRSTNIIDDMIEAELIRDLYNLGHSISILTNAISIVKGKSCTYDVVWRTINNSSWVK